MAAIANLDELTMNKLVSILLLVISGSAMAEWIEFTVRPNGDVFFYDDSRLEVVGDEISVWTRVRYKTSVMAASSYESHVRLHCSEKSKIVLQNTFYTDKNWAKPAMATNTNAKPKQFVAANSAFAQLLEILCDR